MGFFNAAVAAAPTVKAFEYDHEAYYACPVTYDPAVNWRGDNANRPCVKTAGWRVCLGQCLHFKKPRLEFLREHYAHCANCTACWDLARIATLKERDRKAAEEDAKECRGIVPGPEVPPTAGSREVHR